MKTRSSICCKQWCLYNDSEHLIPVKGRLYNLINAHRQNKFNYLSEFLNPKVCQYSVKNLKIHQKCYNDLSKSFCSFNKIEINGKKYFCGKRFYECDLIGGATLKLARMFNINLTSDLICSRHKRLLSNLKIKKLYPRVKKENKTQENQKYLNVDDLSGSIDYLEEEIHDKEGYYFQGDQIIETITISDTEVSTDSESNSEIEELNSDFTISNIKNQNNYTFKQQSAAGRLSHSAIQCCRHCCLSKHDKGFNLGNKLIINDDSVENYLNSNVERKRDFNHNNTDLNKNQIKQKIKNKTPNENHNEIFKKIEIEFENPNDKDIIQDNFNDIYNKDYILKYSKKQNNCLIGNDIENIKDAKKNCEISSINEKNKFQIDEINKNKKKYSTNQEKKILNQQKNNDLYLKNKNIITQKRDDKFIKDLQNFLAILDLQKDSSNYKSFISDISNKYGVLYQKGNPWLYLFNLNTSSFIHFTICWVHLLLEGLFKDGVYNIKLLFNNKYLKLLSKNIDNLSRFYSWLNIPNNPFDVKLTSMEVLDFSMIFALAIEITEFQYFQIKIQEFKKEKNEI
ncbi:hypothetical protein M0812_23734 [Anaeramoeba flamelloides]|uniref:Uncharacterized protein n=1 Tax=Anaeramoeba flamelloides TaxID=1746091 RepID=A0AAV7YPH0_9EUKA|nr:hypothetical protein M0812_23734 [Anaeramoeba flamelloides]